MKKELTIKIIFWSFLGVLMCICSYFIIHNAAWLLGDDCQTLIYTGWDKPIFGFFVSPELGRFFPLDYTIYDILCLFYDDQIPPSAHYFIHIVCFFIYVGSYLALAFYILKEQEIILKYSISIALVILIIGRTYINFIQCWTGIWTIFTFLPVFIYCTIKFLDTHKWHYAVIALISINYILYYYEIMFIIPLSMGIMALIFKHKKMNKNEKIYYSLLVASGLMFLILYSTLVLPKVNNFYGHHLEVTPIVNALKMFYAQKIMWIVVIFLIIRLYHIFKKNDSFGLFDNLLISSCAYCCGAAILGLNYTLYYIPAVVIAIPSILFFSLKYFKSKLTLIIFIVLALFYGRKTPKNIIDNQKVRIQTYSNVQNLIKESDGKVVYFFEPENNILDDWEVEIRAIKRFYLETVTAWYKKDKCFKIISTNNLNTEKGLWQVTSYDEEFFLYLCPSADMVIDFGDSKIYDVK